MSDGKHSEISSALWGQKPLFTRAIVFSVVIGALMLAPSFYMLEVYDRVVNSRSMLTLAMLTLLLALVYFVLEFLQWARMGVLRRVAEQFDQKLGLRVYEAVFCANLSGARDIGLRGLRDFSSVRDFIASASTAALLDIPMALLLVGVIFWIDTTLGWFSLVSACIQAGIAALNKSASAPPLARANGAGAQSQNFVRVALKNGEVVQAMGMAEGLRGRWLQMQEFMLIHQAEASDRGSIYSTLSKYVQLVSSSLMLGLGSWLVLIGAFQGSTGLVLMASIIAGRALAPLVQVIAGWRNVANTQEAMARLEILLTKIPARTAGLSLPAPKGVLQVEQVTAVAPGSNTVLLQNISFAVPAGRLLAVVGPSASGKTSLAHLLTGVWPCVSGKVRLDGADIFAWNKLELGPHMGYLPQNVALFEGSIADNIARFSTPDQAQVEAAARLVGLHDYILSLPEGYDTNVGTEGTVLSGGTRQRVGLARAIYGNPRYVVLDEPNSSLDDAGEAALMTTLQTLRAGGTTVIVITHRTNLLAIADLMLVLVNGESKLFGPAKEVLAALKNPGQAKAPASAPAPAPAPAPVRPAATPGNTIAIRT
ncbi:MAG: type I secretion system permease/ATPase [Zoogloeaceae bacterium]|jgi:ATP-binding cassette subfamily C exporter for protease/lipase|nr:type I secretion system permease/ATPase [Zoogloeaceae bacterium]